MARFRVLLICLGALFSAGLASAQTPVTPILGISTTTLDFGLVAVAYSESQVFHVFNAANDSTSLLQLANVSISGSDFRLVSGPTLPVPVPGDSSVYYFTIGFRPSGEGNATGTITITAPGALNSPVQISLVGEGQLQNAASGHFLIKFTSDALPRGSRIQVGSVHSFSFACADLGDALAAAGVISLERVFPWFDPSDVNTTNEFGEEVRLIDLSTTYVANLLNPQSSAVPAVIALADRDCVEFAELDGIGQADVVPNDQLFQTYQWNLNHTGQFQRPAINIDVNAPEAWNRTVGGNVWVAVLDSGIDSTHAELIPRVHNAPSFVAGESSYDGYTLAPYGHGTAVAGIIAATGNNQIGIAGTAWTTQLINLKTVQNVGGWSDFSVAAAMDWARYDGRADVINCSFSRGLIDPAAGSAALVQALRNAATAGILTCASMGNDNQQTRKHPAADPVVMGVGAVWLDGSRWDNSRVPGAPPPPPGYPYPGSNRGPWIDVVAPGGATITTIGRQNNTYLPTGAPANLSAGAFGGNSASTPQVSGVAALLKSYHGELDGDDLKHILEETATDVIDNEATQGFDIFTGHGIVRADTAMMFVAPPSRSVQHYSVAASSHLFSIQYLDFRNLNDYGGYSNIPDGTYRCEVWRCEIDFVFDQPFVNIPDVWYRTSGTRGWYFDYNHPQTFDFLEQSSSWAGRETYSTTGVRMFTYVFRIEDQDGGFLGYVPEHPNSTAIAITAVGDISPVGVAEQGIRIDAGRASAVPNPSVGHANFIIELAKGGKTSLTIYDLNGRLVRTISTGTIPAGRYSFPWDGKNSKGRAVAPGVYFYQLDSSGRRLVRDKLVIMR